MPTAVKKKWIISAVITVSIIAAGVILYFLFSGQGQIYLKVEGAGFPLKGAPIISNNLKIGEVARALTTDDASGQIFKIRFGQPIHIPLNSEIKIRQSALDSSYTVFLRLVPSKDYFSK
ncbi:MAG: hypothetical protein ACNA7V_15140, partial [Bacteroidales bacterium]